MAAEAWLFEAANECIEEVAKTSPETRAWIATIEDVERFAKFYPNPYQEWASVEQSIAGANLHPAIVPLKAVVRCSNGVLHLYDLAPGENLGGQGVRKRFSALPVEERIEAVLDAVEAVSAVASAGSAVVDWYEGNMHYDFEEKQVWLFDWDLCRPGDSFVLKMDSNYGTSRLMAPEEYVRGSVIDQRTLVFNLGRFAMMYLPELMEELADVVARATHPAKSKRYATASEFRAALAVRPPFA